jgi:ABC-type transport system involved in cytochrome bd biosynthesis fused ATPase/permease subunit
MDTLAAHRLVKSLNALHTYIYTYMPRYMKESVVSHMLLVCAKL